MPKSASPPDMNLLRWIMRYVEKNGFAPSIREIAKYLNLAILSTQRRLLKLKDFGYIDWTPGENRTIRIKKDALGTPVKIEFVGDMNG